MFFRFILKFKKSYYLKLGLFLISSNAFGQLEDYVSLAIKNNRTLATHNSELVVSDLSIKSAKSLLFPRISFDNEYIIAKGGRSIDFATGDLINPLYSSLGQLTGNNNFNRTIPNFKEQFYPNNFYRSGLRLDWSLWNKKKKFRYESSIVLNSIEKRKLSEVEKQLVLDIKIKYFEFYRLHKLTALHEKQIDYLEKLKSKTQKMILHGFAEKIDLDQIKYEILKSNNKKSEIANNKDKLQIEFLNVLGISNDQFQLHLDEEDFINVKPPKLLNIDSIIRLKNDFKILNEKESLVQLEQKTTNDWIPNLNVQIKSGFEGFVEELDLNENYFYFGALNLNWNLFNGKYSKNRKKELVSKKEVINHQFNDLLNQSKTKIERLFIDLKNQYSKIHLLEEKMNLSKTILSQQRKKFLEGDIDLFDLLKFKLNYEKDVTEYYNSKVSYIQGLTKYNFLLQP